MGSQDGSSHGIIVLNYYTYIIPVIPPPGALEPQRTLFK